MALIETEEDIIQYFGAHLVDIHSEKVANFEDDYPTYAVKANETSLEKDSEFLFELKYQGYSLLSAKKIWRQKGQSILVNSSILSEHKIVRAERESFQKNESLLERIKLRFNGPEGDYYELFITGNSDSFPLIIITNDPGTLASNWDYKPQVDLSDFFQPLLSRSHTSTTSTTKVESPNLKTLGIVGYVSFNLFAQGLWFFSSLNYSVKHPEHPRDPFLSMRVVSWLLGFPIIPVQEVIAQTIYYLVAKKFAGLELFRVFEDSNNSPHTPINTQKIQTYGGL
ncbi:hypothetical protein [Endozoicomonas numazuensis]|uniref:Uncharacterized protein n=1 Tax=Endozoicomonas numazuensis TaxID=1137799 RepID=A0A081NDC5_9GAMM|nr:hypothetical protein [Endozoicomonas numazuensis]KEQ16448.1 hypothetical protein GZ78_21545 [Endozoicomonas numazuensis]